VTSLAAPAKLTWSLHVVGVRQDGLHLLDAEMVTLDLADSIELEETDDDEERFVVVAESPATPADTKVGDDDLVHRALRLVGRRAHVSLIKRIPIGAGLGGGSADAAAVLRWAGRTEPELAVSLGADVPFCCVGGRAEVRGVGELIEPLEPVARTVTLALSSFKVDTAACYRAFDELDPGQRQHVRNDLTSAAERVAPQLAVVRDMLEARSGSTFTLAGSGSTMFCEGDPLGLGAAGVEVIETRTGPVRMVLARTEGPQVS
jgi:4-diphosphocytidyl-2-C-methyl-D-erythritol kinase